MLDAVGFEYARKRSQQFNKSNPFYYGVDIVDWQCPETRVIANTFLFSKGLECFNPGICKCAYDIICFPKSISDISPDAILNFANSFSSNMVQDKFCIIVSKRGNSIDDAYIGRKFVHLLAKNLSLKIGWEGREAILKKDDGYFEDELENPFIFNNQIARYINILSEKCNGCLCEHSERCRKTIGKSPMRRVANISPEIYYLEKK